MVAPDIRVRESDIVIVGSGIGGLVCALSLAPRPVTVVTKTRKLEGGSSIWAQGGIAAAVGAGDSPAAHAEDTVAAGAGLSDPDEALRLTEEGVDGLRWLIDAGIPFDRRADGTLELGREAAHRVPRIVHAGGDATGYVIMQSLIDRVIATASIDVQDDTFAYDLVIENGCTRGVVTFNGDDGWVLHAAKSVVLATGGIGMAWWHTTNPAEATGDGLAMAARAGATLANLEFVQFHPTALAVETGDNGASLPLLTEALRGAGAVLLDQTGRRFMPDEHPDADLAPRDVVARAIHERTQRGECVFLDLRPVLEGEQRDAFPTAIRFARDAGFDPFREPLRVTAAAHYHMGGIEIDHRGRGSIEGLWACGEVATSGVHGANRLASNSLLEALVLARDTAADIGARPSTKNNARQPPVPSLPPESKRGEIEAIVARTRDIMTAAVGILRDGVGLAAALEQLSLLGRDLEALCRDTESGEVPTADIVRAFGEARNLVLVGRLVAHAALSREESRGAHVRSDFPEPRAEWRHPQSLTIDQLVDVR